MNWQYEAVESASVHATYWNVNLYNTRERLDGFMKEDFSLLGIDQKPRNLDVITRPYVMAASAEPRHSHFNMRTNAFELVLRGKPLDAPTVIYVPAMRLHPLQPVHYEKHFAVQYNGTLRAQTFEANRLSLLLDPQLDMHEIVIRPL
jgi:hypothetical protein